MTLLLQRGADIGWCNDLGMNVLYVVCSVMYQPRLVRLKADKEDVNNNNNDSNGNNHNNNNDSNGNNHNNNNYFELDNIEEVERLRKSAEITKIEDLNELKQKRYFESISESASLDGVENILEVVRQKSPLKFCKTEDGLMTFQMEATKGRGLVALTGRKYKKRFDVKGGKFEYNTNESNNEEDVRLLDSPKRDLTSTIKLLLRRGVNVDSQPAPQATLQAGDELQNSLSAPPPLPSSPLLMAVQAGDMHVLQCLLAHGADPNTSATDLVRLSAKTCFF